MMGIKHKLYMISYYVDLDVTAKEYKVFLVYYI